jgi:hypothetical protein
VANAGDILKKFYAAVIKRDLTEARRYLDERLQFIGLFETYRSAEEYLSALTKLLQVTVRLDVKKIIAEGNDAAIFFELETKAPVAATTLVAEWHQIRNGKISQVESAFDGRPFAAMFAGGKR